MTRLEEIKERYPSGKRTKDIDHFEVHVCQDIPWLIEQLEKAIECVQFYTFQNANDDGKTIAEEFAEDGYGNKAREFLKEIEK